MRTTILNPKGGVGKTTLAVHILPIFYKENPKRIEIDISNKTINEKKTDIFSPEKRDALLKTIYLTQNLVIDVGANKSCEAFLKLAKEVDIFNEIDFIVIPIVYQEHTSLLLAKEVLKDIPPPHLKKVIIAVNRYPYEELQDKESRQQAKKEIKEYLSPFKDYLKDVGKIFIVIPDMGDFFKKALKGKTLRELFQEDLEEIKKKREEIARRIIQLSIKKEKGGLTAEEMTLLVQLESELDKLIKEFLLVKDAKNFVKNILLPQKSVFSERINRFFD